jgi:hypothetical protein
MSNVTDQSVCNRCLVLSVCTALTVAAIVRTVSLFCRQLAAVEDEASAWDFATGGGMPVEVTETEPQTEPDAEDDQQVFIVCYDNFVHC